MKKHLLAIMLIVSAMVTNGCASVPVKTHDGPTLPPSETAKVKGKINSLASLSPFDNVYILRIDGKALPEPTREIIVLPSKHTITVRWRPGGRSPGILQVFIDEAYNKYDKDMTFSAEKGSEYLIEWYSRPLIIGTGNIDYSIKNVNTNEVIAISGMPDQKP